MHLKTAKRLLNFYFPAVWIMLLRRRKQVRLVQGSSNERVILGFGL